jgi:hypothetical protein
MDLMVASWTFLGTCPTKSFHGLGAVPSPWGMRELAVSSGDCIDGNVATAVDAAFLSSPTNQYSPLLCVAVAPSLGTLAVLLVLPAASIFFLYAQPCSVLCGSSFACVSNFLSVCKIFDLKCCISLTLLKENLIGNEEGGKKRRTGRRIPTLAFLRRRRKDR